MDIEKGQKNLVTQSNKLTEARYSLSVGEQRLVLTILSFISPDDQEFKRYKLNIWDLKKLLQLNTNAVYDQVKEAIERLSTRSVTIPEEGGYLIANWFSSARYVEKENAVYIRIDEDLKPYLLELKEQFTRFNLFTIAQFRSTYTIRIYMLLKQYESIGVREFDLQEFREVLGLEQDVYSDFKRLRARVINQAKKDFEKKDKRGFYQSDITFDLETIRAGRKISRLRFIIRKQEYQNSLELNLPDDGVIEGEAEEITGSPILDELRGYGISQKMASDWLDKYGTDYLEEKIELTLEEERKNPSGYLIKAVQNDWKSKDTQDRQNRKEQKTAHKAKLKALFEQKWQARITERYYADQVEQFEKMLKGTPVLQQLREQAEATHKGNDLPKHIRESAITGTYHQLLKKQVIPAPTPEDLEQLRASVPPPALKTWQGDIAIHAAMKEYIKEFSAIGTADT